MTRASSERRASCKPFYPGRMQGPETVTKGAGEWTHRSVGRSGRQCQGRDENGTTNQG